MNACVDRTVSRRWRGARARRHRRAVSTPRPRPHDLQVAREDRDVERLQSNPLHILGADGQQVFSYVGHMRFGHEPEHVVRYQGQLGSLPGAPLGPGLARRAVEDVRLQARFVFLRLRLRATPQEHTRRRRGERRRRENRRRVERDRGLRLGAAGAARLCQGGHALRVGSRSRGGFHRCRRCLGGNQARAAVVASVTPPGLIAVVRGRPTGVSSAVISDRGGASDARSMRRRRASAVTLLRSALSPCARDAMRTLERFCGRQQIKRSESCGRSLHPVCAAPLTGTQRQIRQRPGS